MHCPIDGTTLQTSDRQGIEIDYCPDCRGVWLDRGELDKIIERSASWIPERDDGARDERQPEKPKKKSKSKSFFETIMESVGEG